MSGWVATAGLMLTYILDSVTYKYLVKQKSKFYSKHPGKRPTAGGDVEKHFRILVLEFLSAIGVSHGSRSCGRWLLVVRPMLVRWPRIVLHLTFTE